LLIVLNTGGFTYRRRRDQNNCLHLAGLQVLYYFVEVVLVFWQGHMLSLAAGATIALNLAHLSIAALTALGHKQPLNKSCRCWCTAHNSVFLCTLCRTTDLVLHRCCHHRPPPYSGVSTWCCLAAQRHLHQAKQSLKQVVFRTQQETPSQAETRPSV
jgi:hypothetical protein